MRRKFKRNIMKGIILVFFVIPFSVSVVYGAFFESYTPSSAVGYSNTQYEVTGVYKGAVQAIRLSTGESVNIHSDTLVRKALNGDIKRGDVISY